MCEFGWLNNHLKVVKQALNVNVTYVLEIKMFETKKRKKEKKEKKEKNVTEERGFKGNKKKYKK